MNDKALPFRYPSELDKEIANLQSISHWKCTKNKALINAVKIASAFLSKVKKKHKAEAKRPYTNYEQYIEKELGISLSSYGVW